MSWNWKPNPGSRCGETREIESKGRLPCKRQDGIRSNQGIFILDFQQLQMLVTQFQCYFLPLFIRSLLLVTSLPDITRQLIRIHHYKSFNLSVATQTHTHHFLHATPSLQFKRFFISTSVENKQFPSFFNPDFQQTLFADHFKFILCDRHLNFSPKYLGFVLQTVGRTNWSNWNCVWSKMSISLAQKLLKPEIKMLFHCTPACNMTKIKKSSTGLCWSSFMQVNDRITEWIGNPPAIY